MAPVRSLEQIVGSLHEGLIVVNTDWLCIYANVKAGAIVGRPAKDLLGKNFWEVCPALVGTQVEDVCRRGFVEQTRSTCPYFHSASSSWFEVTLYPSKTDMALMFREKRMQDLLPQNQWQPADVFQRSAVAMHWVGPDGQVLWANDTELKMLGYEREEYVGQHISKFHVDPEAIEDILARLNARQEIHEYETQLRCKDGSLKDVLISSNVLWEKDTFVHTQCFTFDVTGRKRWERGQALLGALIESSEDAIITKTLQGVVLSWNASAERLFGYTAAEAIGQPVTFLMPPDRINEEPGIIERLVRGDRVEHFETVRRRKDGTHIHVSLSISPIRDSTGKIVAASKIARDISPQKRAETALQAREAHFRELAATNAQLYNRALEADRLKDEFLATLSHELRTPLNSVNGWTALLRSGQLDEAGKLRALGSIERSAKAQARLVEDMLDVSCIVTGRMSLEIVAMDLRAVIQSAVDAIRPTADLKSVRLETIMDSRAEMQPGDPDRIQQVVWNLLSNAVKFTPKGGRVQVRLERMNSHVELTVSDTGEGIPPEFLPYVFDRFRQAEASTSRRRGGLGLGLAIVRHLVELHAGTVEAKSAGVGAGATFIVKLPMNIVRPELPVPEDAAAVQTDKTEGSLERPIKLTGVRFLVIDDDPDARLLLTTILETHGGTVTVAGSAEEGIAELKRVKPDILLSDIGMPGEDGYMLIRRVRALDDPDVRNVPAIALTAHARLEDRVRALKAGYDSHVAKPFEPVELAMIASRVISRARASRK